MTTDIGLIEHLRELLEPIPGVTFRRMFGGHGLFRSGLMFGLIAEDTLYFKVDEQNKADFTARDLGPFVYYKGDKPMPMSYWRAPDETLDDSAEMVAWAEKAYQAAVRAQAAKPAKKKK
jgi:DNA transformation protein and related proteins